MVISWSVSRENFNLIKILTSPAIYGKKNRIWDLNSLGKKEYVIRREIIKKYYHDMKNG